MNAYELADYMDNNIDAYYATEQKHLDNAANMLRQQADQIAELGKKTKPLSDEEILNEWLGNDRNFYYFARAIEERHGIK